MTFQKAQNNQPVMGGLSTAQATARLRAEGPNELPRQMRRTPLRVFFEVLKEPMLALLLAGGLTYLALGDFKEALVIMTFAMLSIVITVIQESRTERVLEALRDLTSPRALVMRDGERKRIPGREVVRDDLVLLSEGDRVPADGHLLDCHDLMIDESLLTGESVPVHKQCELAGDPKQEPDATSVYAGTLVVRGHGKAIITAIGIQSQIGTIGQSLVFIDPEPPRLQHQIRRLVRLFALLGGIVSLFAVILYVSLRGELLDGILAGIALGIAMLPEEFPVVLTVFMAMGAWRISKANVLTRRAAAIEALGSATVLCADKTGTLTQNRMSIAAMQLADGTSLHPDSAPDQALPEGFEALVQTGVLASAAQPFDPMEEAFHALGEAHGLLPRSEWKLVREYGLRPDLLAVTHVWQKTLQATDLVVAVKGAPEAVAQLCHFSQSRLSALKIHVDSMALQGLRVLGVARAIRTSQSLPESPHDFNFMFSGLVGLADLLRESVPDAIAECRTAGIRVMMITGDYPATARAIAQQAGLAYGDMMTGSQLADISNAELSERIGTAAIFARTQPEQKLRIVNALKANGEIVAMTGDGVNDAPAIKAAHIGIAMGGRGTDVAREASSIVLLDDDFGSIVQAIKLGRRIYDNLTKAMAFIFAVHVPIAGLTLMPLLLDLPILFGPIHIAFLEMVIDPVCSLVFEAEPEEADLMKRPPRAADVPLFSPRLVFWSALQGGLAFAMVAFVFLLALGQGMPESEIRALVFFSTVWSIIGLTFVNRSFSASLYQAVFRHNRIFAIVLAVIIGTLATTLAWPPAANLFRFGPLHPLDLAITVLAGLGVLIVLELVKSALHPNR